MAIAPATATFSEPSTPRDGIEANASQWAWTTGRSPGLRPPARPPQAARRDRQSTGRPRPSRPVPAPTAPRFESGRGPPPGSGRGPRDDLCGAGRDASDRCRYAHRPPGSDHDAIEPGPVGASKQRAQVVRIHDPVEEQQRLGVAGQQRVERGVPIGTHHRDDALVVEPGGQPVDLPAGNRPDGDTRPLRPLPDVADDPRWGQLLGDEHSLCRAPRLEQLDDRSPPGHHRGLLRRPRFTRHPNATWSRLGCPRWQRLTP